MEKTGAREDAEDAGEYNPERKNEKTGQNKKTSVPAIHGPKKRQRNVKKSIKEHQDYKERVQRQRKK